MNLPTRQRVATGRWTRTLWLLSALSGGFTVWSVVVVVHDARRLSTATSAMLQPRADAAIRLAEDRLALQMQSLAAVAIGTPGASAPHIGERIGALYQHAARCDCLTLMPAAWAWVRVSHHAPPAIVPLRGQPMPPPSQIETMASLMRRSLSPRDGVATTRVHDSAWPDSLVVVRFASDSSAGSGVSIGLVVAEFALAASLFSTDGPVTESTFRATDLRVFGEGQRRLLGAAIDSSALSARSSSTRLGGWTAAVAVEPRRLASALSDDAELYRRWHLAPQLLLTVVAVTLAARSGRAELRLLRARSDFVTGVSHDLRMPLAEVLLAAETLEIEGEASPARRTALVRTVLREARRVIGMIENVLLFAHSESPFETAAFARQETIDVSALLSDTAEGASMAAEAAGQFITVSAAVPLTPALRVRGDERLLRQALGNFVDNAIKYGGQGQMITLGATRESEDWVALTVDDQGPGIPRAERARMTQPYERLVRDRESTRTGSGLGLAVAMQIATLSGGSLRIEDGPGGVGTQVILRVPRAAGDAMVGDV